MIEEQATSDWQHVAIVGKHTDNVIFRRGYIEAANFLVQRAIENRGYMDFFVLPIVHLYRHHIELSLKEILRGYGALNGRLHHSHDLLKLWAEARRNLEADEPDRNEYDIVEICLREIHDIDSKSFAFRYPTDKNDHVYLKQDLRIDLQQMRNTMEAIGGFFTGVTCWLAERRERERC